MEEDEHGASGPAFARTLFTLLAGPSSTLFRESLTFVDAHIEDNFWEYRAQTHKKNQMRIQICAVFIFCLFTTADVINKDVRADSYVLYAVVTGRLLIIFTLAISCVLLRNAHAWQKHVQIQMLVIIMVDCFVWSDVMAKSTFHPTILISYWLAAWCANLMSLVGLVKIRWIYLMLFILQMTSGVAVLYFINALYTKMQLLLLFLTMGMGYTASIWVAFHIELQARVEFAALIEKEMKMECDESTGSFIAGYNPTFNDGSSVQSGGTSAHAPPLDRSIQAISKRNLAELARTPSSAWIDVATPKSRTSLHAVEMVSSMDEGERARRASRRPELIRKCMAQMRAVPSSPITLAFHDAVMEAEFCSHDAFESREGLKIRGICLVLMHGFMFVLDSVVAEERHVVFMAIARFGVVPVFFAFFLSVAQGQCRGAGFQRGAAAVLLASAVSFVALLILAPRTEAQTYLLAVERFVLYAGSALYLRFVYSCLVIIFTTLLFFASMPIFFSDVVGATRINWIMVFSVLALFSMISTRLLEKSRRRVFLLRKEGVVQVTDEEDDVDDEETDRWSRGSNRKKYITNASGGLGAGLTPTMEEEPLTSKSGSGRGSELEENSPSGI